MKQLQSRNELKTNKDMLLYDKVLKKLNESIESNFINLNSKHNLNSDRQRQHKVRIRRLIVNGKINPKLKVWMENPTKYDVISIDDVPQDLIKKVKYGKILTKTERKRLNLLRKISNKRSEKELIKDLSRNDNILKIENYKKWNRNKKKYDIDGVDTIPYSVAGDIANELQKKFNSTNKKKKYVRTSINLRGYFRYPKTENQKRKNRFIRISRILKGTTQGSKTFAHEVGHSIDLIIKGMKKPSKKIIDDMEKLAVKLNPPPISFEIYKEHIRNGGKKNKFMEYRLNHKELFADSFAYIIYNTSNAKKIAPYAYNYIVKSVPDMQKIIRKTKKKHILKIVKTIKGDKQFLEKENKKKLINKKLQEINKIKGYKKIGNKRKNRISKLQSEIKEIKKNYKIK